MKNIRILLIFFVCCLQISCKGNDDNNTLKINSPENTILQPKFLFVEPSSGCENIFVYEFDQNKLEVIIVAASKEKLDLSIQTKSFNIEETREGLEVYVDVHSTNKDSRGYSYFPYCNDVISSEYIQPRKWIAKKGKVTITISKDNPERGEIYTTNIKLENIYFYDVNNENELYSKELEFKDVKVGIIPG